MKCRILISAPYAIPVLEYYRREIEAAGCEVVVAPVVERLNEEQLLELVEDVSGMICGDDQITERVLARAHRLQVISKWGTGIDSIDRAAAARYGIAVYNTPNAFSEPVADSVMGYILLFARQLDAMDRDLRGGRWVKRQLTALREITLGVIGVGNCGKAVVRRAVAFGMTVLGNDLVEMPAGFLERTGIRMAPRVELLRQSDFVTLHPTLNETSYHLIDEEALALMKRTAFLINTSRGPVVDEAALVKALETRQIAGAALDVFETEPLPAASPLLRLPNCLLASHNANSSPEAARRVHENTIHNLLGHLCSMAAGSR